MLIDHDLHVHTNLSACGAPECEPRELLSRASACGLRTVCFTDHLWDPRLPGASDWYRPQTLEHVQRIRRMLPPPTEGLRVLVGCESEYAGPGRVGIGPEAAGELDFVLIAASHLHMGPFVVPEWVHTTRDIARLLVERLQEALALGATLGVPTGIAHPLLPCGQVAQADEILSHVPDIVLTECFAQAAALGVSIEVSTGMFPSCRQGQTAGFHDETFVRVLSLACQAGCRFHCASDAHRLDAIGSVRCLAPFVHAAGITEQDLLPLARTDEPRL